MSAEPWIIDLETRAMVLKKEDPPNGLLLIKRTDVLRLCEQAKRASPKPPETDLPKQVLEHRTHTFDGEVRKEIGELKVQIIPPSMRAQYGKAVEDAENIHQHKVRVKSFGEQPPKPAKLDGRRNNHPRCVWRTCRFCLERTNRNLRNCCPLGTKEDVEDPTRKMSKSMFYRQKNHPEKLPFTHIMVPKE